MKMPQIPTSPNQLRPTRREKLFKELEKLAKELLIYRRELTNTIRQVKRLIRSQKYNSTNVRWM